MNKASLKKPVSIPSGARISYVAFQAMLTLLVILVAALWLDKSFPTLTSSLHIGSVEQSPVGKFGDQIIPVITFIVLLTQTFFYRFFIKSGRGNLESSSVSEINSILFYFLLPLTPQLVLWIQGSPIAPFGNVNFLWALLSSGVLSQLVWHFVSDYKAQQGDIGKVFFCLVTPVAWVATFSLNDSPSSSSIHLKSFLDFSFIQVFLFAALFLIRLKLSRRQQLFAYSCSIVVAILLLSHKYSFFLSINLPTLIAILLLVVILSWWMNSKFSHLSTVFFGSIAVVIYYLSTFDFSSIWTNFSDDFGAGEQYTPFFEFSHFHLWPIRDFVVPHGFLEDFLPNLISKLVLKSSIAGIGFGLMLISAFLAVILFLLLSSFIDKKFAFVLAILFPGPGYRYMTELYSLVLFLVVVKLYLRSVRNFRGRFCFGAIITGALITTFFFAGLLLAPGQTGVCFGSVLCFVVVYSMMQLLGLLDFEKTPFSDVMKFIGQFLAGSLAICLAVYFSPLRFFIKDALLFGLDQSKSNISVNGIPLGFSVKTPGSFSSPLSILLLLAIPACFLVFMTTLRSRDGILAVFSITFAGWFSISNTRYWGRIDPQMLSRAGLGLSIFLFGFTPIALSRLYVSSKHFLSENFQSWFKRFFPLAILLTILAIFSSFMPNPFVPNSLPSNFNKQNADKSIDYAQVRFSVPQQARIASLNHYLDVLDPSKGPFINFTNNTILDISIARKVTPNITSLYAIADTNSSENAAIDNVLSTKPLAGLGDVGNNIQNDGVSISLRNPKFWSVVMPLFDPVECGPYILLRSKNSPYQINDKQCKIPTDQNTYLQDLERINGDTSNLFSIPGQLLNEIHHFTKVDIVSTSLNQDYANVRVKTNFLSALVVHTSCYQPSTITGQITSISNPKLTEKFQWTPSGYDSIIPLYAFPITLLSKNLTITIQPSSACNLTFRSAG